MRKTSIFTLCICIVRYTIPANGVVCDKQLCDILIMHCMCITYIMCTCITPFLNKKNKPVSYKNKTVILYTINVQVL